MTNLKKKEFIDNLFWISIVVYFLLISFMSDKLNLMLNPNFLNLFLFSPFILIVFPYLFYNFYIDNIIKKKMREVPRLLRDISEKFMSGIDLISSINSLDYEDYYYLKEDIYKFQNSIDWGISVEESFLNFAKRIKDSNFLEEIKLILEAKKIGGNIEILLLELSRKIEKDNKRNKEKEIALFETNFTGYVSFILFLVMFVILYNTLFLELAGAGLESEDARSEEINFILSLFMILSYELAVLSGFIFGFMQETKFSSGAFHIFNLSTICFFIFLLFI